jgi:hypothetical protein
VRKLIENISTIIVVAYVLWPLWFFPAFMIYEMIVNPLVRPW